MILDISRGHDKKGIIIHDKRLKAAVHNKATIDKSINTGMYIISRGFSYRIHLNFYDNSDIHGNVSLKTLYNNTSLCDKSKELLSKEEKKYMLQTIKERPEDFNKYSTGDLYNYDAAIANDAMFNALYKELGLKGNFSTSKQTISYMYTNYSKHV
uniref:Uncharacterized protein n=1 Tax=Corynecladia elata TaxID=3101723 RepID=A0AA51NFA9_9FLOR|nr:hypothetical protein RU988_pgp209 [Laurencia elata]WMP12585.1 hypothetical protein [Laurencia elata]